MARIAPLDSARADRPTQALFQELRRTFGKVPNLFATVAHYPQALKPLLEYFHAVYTRSSLPKRVLELVILRSSVGRQSDYCLTLHKAFALEHGVTYDEIMSLSEDPRHTRFGEPERVVLDYAAQVVSDSRGVTDELFARVRRHYSEAEVLNVTLLIGLVEVFSCLSNALNIPMDPPTPTGGEMDTNDH